ncbi:MAG: hypothetical protein P8J37_24195 [Fuerstiella sp.]|nr:hypothetical protein [Fuerstiella sp.]
MSHHRAILTRLRYYAAYIMPTPKQSEDRKSDSPVPRAGRRGRWFGVILIVAGIAPTVVSGTGHVPSLLHLCHPELARTVNFESETMYWWSGVCLTDVVALDLTADHSPDKSSLPLLTADTIVTRQPLWQLVMSAGQGIDITIDRPTLNIRVFDGTTNIEQTVRKLFPNADSSSNSVAPTVKLTVTRGTVRVLSEDLISNEATVLTEVRGQFSNGHSTSGVPRISVAAFVGESSVATTARQSVRSSEGVNPRIAATLENLAGDYPRQPQPNDPLNIPEDNTSRPALSMQLGTSDESGDRQQLIIEARQLNLAALTPLMRRFLPGAVCRGKCSCRVHARLLGPTAGHGIAGRIQVLGEGVQWRQESWADGEILEFGTITARGGVALATDGLLLQDLKLRSNILDVDGAGEVNFGAGDPVAAMRATTGQQSDRRQHVVSEATAAASGQVRLNGKVNLAAISRMIPRTLNISDDVVIDTGGIVVSCRMQRAAPTGSTTPQKRAPETDLQWRLLAETSPIQAVRAGQRITVNSPIRLVAVGLAGPGHVEMRRATIDGNFGSVSADAINGGFAVRGSVSPLRLWQELRPLIDLPQPQLASDVNLEVDVQSDGDVVKLQNVLLESTEVSVSSRQITIAPTRNVLQMVNGSLIVEGTTSAIKTMLAPWYQLPWLAENSTLVANLNAQPEQRLALKCELRQNGGNATLPHAHAFVVSEGRIEFSIIADRKTGAFVVERGQVELPGLQSDVSGTLGIRHGLLTVNLSADTAYDLKRLSTWISAAQNSSVSISGQGRHTFQLRGAPSLLTEMDVARFLARHADDTSTTDSPSIMPLSASGRVAWQGGRVYGLSLGAGSATIELSRGQLRTEPIHCSLGSGNIDVMPQWDLTGNRMQLASGSRIQNLKLTPEMCNEWLGYVAPMMAEATEMQGEFSARVHKFDYNVDKPEQSTVHAVLSVHSATATAGASLRQLLQVISLLEKRTTIETGTVVFPPQEIPFEMRDGMVIHDGLQVVAGGYYITSRGGVGFNRELRLALDVPLERSETGLENSVRIPFSGTIDRPMLDTSGLLGRIGNQQIGRRVNEQIDRGLNRLLDKLR